MRCFYADAHSIFVVNEEGKLSLQPGTEDKFFIRRAALLKSLLNVSLWQWQRIYPEEILRLLADAQAGEFLFSTQTLTKNPLPSYKKFIWQPKLMGPASGCGDISIEEFAFTDRFYTAYKRTGNPEELHRFIAMIYRPADKDKKKAFDKESTDDYLHLIEKWPMDIKLCIVIFYEQVRSAWIKKYTEIFAPITPTPSGTGGGWIDVFLKMAGGKFGTFEATIKTNAIIFFEEMTNIIKENRNEKTSIH